MKSDETYEPTIQSTSNMALLLDLLRAKDEEEAWPYRRLDPRLRPNS